MRKLTMILMFLTLIISCCKHDKKQKIENESPLNNRDFVLTTELHSSRNFFPACRVIIERKDTNKTISIAEIYTDKKILEKANINNKDFKYFVESINRINLLTQKDLFAKGIDGNSADFTFKTSSRMNKFSFRYPVKPDTVQSKLLLSVFKLLETSFTITTTKIYIENIKAYFELELPIKHISDNPIEFRFYGILSLFYKNELNIFFDSLPKNKTIIFDFSNYKGIDRRLYNNFKKMIDRNSEIYWIVNEHSREQAKEIGVKPNKIFMNRTQLIKRLKNEP